MSEVEFKFEDKEWQRFLKKLQVKWQDIEDRKRFAGHASAIVFKDIVKHFEDQQGPEGKWTKWSEVYANHLKRIGRGKNLILNFGGHLKGSFLPAKQKFRSNPLGVLLYSNIEYAATHDYGDPSRNIPQRKFMYLSSDGMDTLVDSTQKWLSEDL